MSDSDIIFLAFFISVLVVLLAVKEPPEDGED